MGAFLSPSEASENSPVRVTLAWGVHAFTASGALVGAVALLAIGAGELSRAAFLMVVALAIDSVDGALARAVRVRDVLPQVDGRRLDDMVDFLNYVIVPGVFLVAAGLIASWAWAAVPILASAYGFSQEHAKTEDDFFLGFPSYWNVVALYLWLLEVPAAAGTALVVVLAILVFVPFKYIYPSKLLVLGRTTLATGAIWVVFLGVAALWPARLTALGLVQLSLAYPAYYLLLSFRLGGLHRA